MHQQIKPFNTFKNYFLHLVVLKILLFLVYVKAQILLINLRLQIKTLLIYFRLPVIFFCGSFLAPVSLLLMFHKFISNFNFYFIYNIMLK